MHRNAVRRGVLFAFALVGLLCNQTSLRAVPAVDPGGVPGTYSGFFQSHTIPNGQFGSWGFLRFEISPDVRNRKWMGAVTMIFPTDASPIEVPFPVDGTISASGEFTGRGSSPAGGVFFHGQITLLQGGAAVVDSSYRFCPSAQPGALPPPCDDGTSNLFRRFVIPEGTPNPPNLNGLWDGLYSSFGKGGDGSFHIDVTQCAERSIGDVNGIIAVLSRDFHGVEIIDGNTDEPYFFMGNFGPDNMFVVAGWNNFRDHFIVTGDYSPPDPNTGGMASAEGFYALTTGEGITDRGSLHDWVQKFLATPPDPEKCGGITNPPR